MSKLFEELKRRKVFRIAGVYSVVGWVLAQVAAFAVETFAAPQWVQQIFVVFLILGFPIAIILAWAFEATPEGARSSEAAPSIGNVASSSDRKLVYATFALVLLVAGFQITDRVLGDSSNNTAEEAPQLLVDTEPAEVARFNINLGVSYPKLYETLSTDLAMSPNGQNIVYTINTATNSAIFVRNTRELEPRKIFENDSNGAFSAFKPKISPNGQQVLFGSVQSLLLIPLDGGSEREISNSIESIGGWGWLDDNQIIFVSGNKELILYSLSTNSGEILPAPADLSPRWPEGIPTKNAFLYTAIGIQNGPGGQSVRLYDMDTGISETLIAGAYQAKYVPTGHIVFTRGQNLWAVPFDLESMTLNGPEVPIENNISSFESISESVSAISTSGRLAYLPSASRNTYRDPRIPVWVDRQGNEETLAIDAGTYFSPRISPDGSKLALLRQEQSAGRDIVVWDFASERDSRLTFAGDVGGPVWSTDGNQLLYTRQGTQLAGTEESGIWRFSANGLGQPERIVPLVNQSIRLHFTDSRSNRIIYRTGQGTINNEIRSFSLAGDESNELLFPRADQYEASISPDGNWIAVAKRDGAGSVGIFVSPYPNTQDGTFLVAENGRQPAWGPNSDEIFFINDYTKVLHSSRVVSTEPFLTEQGPEIASNIHHDIAWPPSYAVSPDGERFLVLRYEDVNFTQERRLDLVIVDNWFEELKRLAPAD